jgi:hypothetical protein
MLMLNPDDLRAKADTWRDHAREVQGSERDAALKIADAYDQLAEIWADADGISLRTEAPLGPVRYPA